MVNVNELRYKSIPEIIKILGILENEDSATADLTKLAYSLNVSVLARNFKRTEISVERIFCAFVTNGKGNSCIFYSDDLPYKEARIIILSAFAKYIITGNNNFFVTWSTDFSEKEKMLTAELLMPKLRVAEVIAQLILPSTVALADIFQVPEEFVKHRLDEFGIKTLISGYNTTQEAQIMMKLFGPYIPEI